jgi:6-pyruvoyltetrahydropterin/6-carboxytetrahydropterin synthase
MYNIKVTAGFSAAHFLRGYTGKCENLHGHNWKVEAIVSSDTLDSLGMVMDFSGLKKDLNVVLEELDHKHLNEIEYFKTVNPSSENICRYIFDRLKNSITVKNCRLVKIKVWETENSCASYNE